jgi:F0F1-type ATP synthase gamma subunit
MATVKQLRLRVASVKSIQRITKTMQMVAGAKLKGFQTRMMQVYVLLCFSPKSRIIKD